MNLLKQLQPYMGRRRMLLPVSLLLSALSAVAGLLLQESTSGIIEKGNPRLHDLASGQAGNIFPK